MPTPRKNSIFIKAWADGETIQVKDAIGWIDLTIQNPNWEGIYRIKPKPQQIEGWIGHAATTGHRHFHTSLPHDTGYFKRCCLTIYPDE